ncbi:hypothetical protein ACEV6Q_12665 [Enterobacter ludwigii]|uniref:hypothetical protein n=1 Tax=Enterobacter ludwigii TaxID=299767 RepID=UPI003BEF1F79
MTSNLIEENSMKAVRKNKIQLKTIEAESVVQCIARNIAWYAFRIARRSYCDAYQVVTVLAVTTLDKDKHREIVHRQEMIHGAQGDSDNLDPENTVPLHHVLFRGWR